MIVLEDILNAIEDKKCEDVVAINTEGRNPFADYIIIGSARGSRSSFRGSSVSQRKHRH